MPNEAIIEETEEVDVLTLLAKQSEKVGTEDAEDDGLGDDAPATIEEYQALLARKDEIIGKRNKSIKKAKDAQHRTQDERDKALAQLSSNADVSERTRSDTEAERHEQETQDWKDRYEENPASIFDYISHLQNERDNNLAGYLQDQFSKLGGEITGLRTATNPTRIKLADRVNELRQIPKFANMNDDALFSIAEVLGDAKVKAPRGSVSGKRVQADKKPAPNYGGLTRDELRKKQGFKPRG